jgi:hypothetical protein
MTNSLNTEISNDEVSPQDSRCEVEMLLGRVNLLSGSDRAIMKMYFELGSSCGQLAILMGVEEYKIARRIQRIKKRLMDCRYIMCLRSRASFTAFEMSIAKDYFVRGLSIKKMAKKRQLSFYSTRKKLLDIEARLRMRETGRRMTEDR